MSTSNPNTPIFFSKLFKTHKIICNNSVNQGACYGDSYCSSCQHPDVWCGTCKIRICGCCYALCYHMKCPSCQLNTSSKIKSIF